MYDSLSVPVVKGPAQEIKIEQPERCWEIIKIKGYLFNMQCGRFFKNQNGYLRDSMCQQKLQMGKLNPKYGIDCSVLNAK